MVLIGREVLSAFIVKHADAKSWVENWIYDVEGASWKNTHDIKIVYPSVSFVDGIVIFNVKGNNYRMETKIGYQAGVVKVIWIDTHAEYDKRNKRNKR